MKTGRKRLTSLLLSYGLFLERELKSLEQGEERVIHFLRRDRRKYAYNRCLLVENRQSLAQGQL